MFSMSCGIALSSHRANVYSRILIERSQWLCAPTIEIAKNANVSTIVLATRGSRERPLARKAVALAVASVESRRHRVQGRRGDRGEPDAEQHDMEFLTAERIPTHRSTNLTAQRRTLYRWHHER